jgi:hypothetical protein
MPAYDWRGALLDNARYGVCCTKRVAFRRAQRFVRLKHWLARDLQLHEARALAKRLGADYKARWPGRHSWVGTLFGIETEFPPKAAILATADELSVDRRFFALQQRRDGYWEVKP